MFKRRKPKEHRQGACFNGKCGSSLFYRYASSQQRWSFYLSSLENIPADISLGRHSFREQKPFIYDIVSGMAVEDLNGETKSI